MLTNFFSKDNATAKLSTTLVLVASLLSFTAKSFETNLKLNLILLAVAGVATIGAQFFQANKVYKTSAWLTLGYLVADYLATTQLPYPEAKVVFLYTAGVLKAIAGFSTQQPGDAKPPVADALPTAAQTNS